MGRIKKAYDSRPIYGYFAVGFAAASLLLAFRPLIIVFGFGSYALAFLFSMVTFVTATGGLALKRERPASPAVIGIVLALPAAIWFCHLLF